MLVSYYHDPGGGLTHVSCSNLTNIFRMGWNKRQIGILEYSHEGINHQMQGSVSVKMKVGLLSHEVSCLHTITPASSPFWETQNTQSTLPGAGSLLRLAWALAVINEAVTMGNSDIFPWWWHHPLLRICTLLCQYMLPAYANSDDS